MYVHGCVYIITNKNQKSGPPPSQPQTNSPNLHHRTHKPQHPFPPLSCRIPLSPPRNIHPIPLRPTPTETHPLPCFCSIIIIIIIIKSRRRPPQRLIRLVDLPPPSLPPPKSKACKPSTNQDPGSTSPPSREHLS